MQLRRSKRKTEPEPYDLWEGRKEHKKDQSAITKAINKLHPSLKRTRKTPLPHPGQSYNPNPEDHRRLLSKVMKKELEFQKKQRSLHNAMKVKVSAKELKQSEREELESGIKHLIKKSEDGTAATKGDDSSSSTDDDAFSDYDERDFQAIMKDKKVVEKRKSKQQRLRQLKDRLQRKAAKLRKLKNIRLSKFDAIKKMIKELDKKQKEEEEKRKKIRKGKKVKNERFCQKFEQSDPIYCLSNELPSSLREASCPMNSIVREQLENFQSRLMIEPSSLQVAKRKYKKKRFDRLTAAEQEEV